MESLNINGINYKIFNDVESAVISSLDYFAVKIGENYYECYNTISNERGERRLDSFAHYTKADESEIPEEGGKTEKTQGENAIDVLNILLAPGNGVESDSGIDGPEGEGMGGNDKPLNIDQLKNNARKLRKLLGVDL